MLARGSADSATDAINEALTEHSRHALSMSAFVGGTFINGELRAVVEVYDVKCGTFSEVALVVEKRWRHRGLGRALSGSGDAMGRTIRSLQSAFGDCERQRANAEAGCQRGGRGSTSRSTNPSQHQCDGFLETDRVSFSATADSKYHGGERAMTIISSAPLAGRRRSRRPRAERTPSHSIGPKLWRDSTLIVSCDGVAIRFYELGGACDAPPIVFGHGSGFAAGSYLRFLSTLAGCRVFTFDARAHGGSNGQDQNRKMHFL
jgi:hypothetical protein